jgi:hypothetical protein
MDDALSEKLCARLTGTIAKKSADNFYKDFLLHNNSICEYHFNEMKQIVSFPAMDEWRKTLVTGENTKEQSDILLSLVCFQKADVPSPQRLPTKRLVTAHDKACHLFHTTFHSEADNKCIDVAMSNFPTMAIFMAREADVKKRKNQRKSVLDVRDTDKQLHCLAAVNYFREGQHTQVLWLATTMEEPPEDSIHVMWQGRGLATYLLCLLVKQHTGIEADMKNSILSLQASNERDNDAVVRFYLKVGFICHKGLPDNGLSRTSKGFQDAVKKFPAIWVHAKEQHMSFFCLCQGRLKLLLLKNLPQVDDHSTKTWKDYQYARFPWQHPSLRRIEQYFDNRPIFQCLSGDPLPLTDRPFIATRSPSKIAGTIEGEQRTGMNDHSWLRTDEIQFICALLLRNHESNRLFHVLGPTITHQISILYKSFQRAKEGTQTEKEKREYENNMDVILKYIDSRLDILQHKFLVFLCNVRHMHWLSVVVVNPFLVLEQEEQQQKENQDTLLEVTDCVGGWCVLNSIQHNKEKEKMVSREPLKQKMRHQWEFVYF